jgi:hypothetical protein
MKAHYETLDEYLDALDAIKERIAEATQGMSATQAKTYFARAKREPEKATGQSVRGRRDGRKNSPAKR